MTKPFLLLIQLYRLMASPYIRNCCRFYPSCSEYAYEAIERLGVFRGLFLTLYRLLSCHRWHPGGIDEVPTSLKSWWKIKRKLK